jgi:hypothetical protein
MGFCDNCKTCGFFYDTSRNDLCPKCVVMAAEKDTSKATKSFCPKSFDGHHDYSHEAVKCITCDFDPFAAPTQTVLQPWVPKTVYVLRDDLKRAYDKLDLGESTAVAIYLYPHRDTVPDLEKFERTEEAPAATKERGLNVDWDKWNVRAALERLMEAVDHALALDYLGKGSTEGWVRERIAEAKRALRDSSKARPAGDK